MIGEPRFLVERLGREHDRASFVCAREPTLQAYLTDPGRALREHERNIAVVHLLVDTKNDRKIAGYFTLSNASLVPAAVPSELAKKLPRYESWGCIRLGRMARDDHYRDAGIGPILIARAFRFALELANTSATLALIVDAKNDRLAAWYAALGFQPLVDRPRTLLISNATMAAYVEALKA